MPPSMHILMIAPEPFFEPRGTAFSEYHRIRALTDLGHTVDLVTYPFGNDVPIRGLRVYRSLRPPFMRRIGIGPSLAKVPLDVLLALTAVRRAFSGRYDAVHSHEEGIAIGIVLAWFLRLPHLYDMHSSLPQQLTNFAFSRSRLLTGLFVALERFVVRHSRVVMAGGHPKQIAAVREEVARRGVADAVVFAGQRPASEIPLYLRMADILVSPRSTGTNTPLKIYQYLRSGTPIVATRLLTHTQVLTDDIAVLTPPTPEGFAEGILRLMADPRPPSPIAPRPPHLAATKHTYHA